MTQTLEPANGAETAMARRNSGFNPLAPIGSAGSLKGLLESQRNSIAQALPRHVTPERIIKTLLVAANRNPDILKCTQASILETINRSAELGLDLSGTLGEAYPVPFRNKVKWRDDEGREHEEWLMQLQLIIGYRGYEKLAWQSGMVDHLDAEVVCEKDEFSFKKGTQVELSWSPCLKEDRGAIVGAYCCIGIKGGGKLARFLPVSDLEKIRAASKSGNSPAWSQWKGEMYRKCAIKRTLKDAPLSTEKLTAAMEADEADYALTDVLEAETARPRGAQALVDKLRSRGHAPVTDPYGQPVEIPEPPASEEEANRIIEEKAQAAESTSQVDEYAAPPQTLPPEARTDPKATWIDDLIVRHARMTGVGGITAKKAFHGLHGAVSWHLLDPAEQDRLYGLLITDQIDLRGTRGSQAASNAGNSRREAP